MTLSARGVKTPPKTKFEQWLDTLTDKNHTVVVGWLKSPGEYSNIEVARMVRDDDADDAFTGYPATGDTIAEWRRNA